MYIVHTSSRIHNTRNTHFAKAARLRSDSFSVWINTRDIFGTGDAYKLWHFILRQVTAHQVQRIECDRIFHSFFFLWWQRERKTFFFCLDSVSQHQTQISHDKQAEKIKSQIEMNNIHTHTAWALCFVRGENKNGKRVLDFVAWKSLGFIKWFSTVKSPSVVWRERVCSSCTLHEELHVRCGWVLIATAEVGFGSVLSYAVIVVRGLLFEIEMH